MQGILYPYLPNNCLQMISIIDRMQPNYNYLEYLISGQLTSCLSESAPFESSRALLSVDNGVSHEKQRAQQAHGGSYGVPLRVPLQTLELGLLQLV